MINLTQKELKTEIRTMISEMRKEFKMGRFSRRV